MRAALETFGGILLVAGATACGAAPPSGVESVAFRTVSDAASPDMAAPVAGRRARVVILGDSLTAGLGLPEEEAFPARLQARVDAERWPIKIEARGVSGDTTAGGRRRFAWALDGDVRLLVVALGGNDALRGLPVTQMRDNLTAIIDDAAARDIPVVLAGMEAPPNFGLAYTSQFREAFRALAETHHVTYIPFLLDGVAGNPALNQRDGIHPNAAGAERVAAHLWTTLEPLMAKLATAQPAEPVGGTQ